MEKGYPSKIEMIFNFIDLLILVNKSVLIPSESPDTKAKFLFAQRRTHTKQTSKEAQALAHLNAICLWLKRSIAFR